jgi:uncharacterized protein YjeT (DUF2065 family)
MIPAEHSMAAVLVGLVVIFAPELVQCLAAIFRGSAEPMTVIRLVGSALIVFGALSALVFQNRV